MDRTNLTGKAILVTGGASGIGLATVEAFASRGARVALNHLRGDKRGLEEVDRLLGLGYDVRSAPGSISDSSEAEAMVTDAIGELGGLDCLINNAGTAGTDKPIPFEDLDSLTESFWSLMISTNLVGHFRCTKAAVSALRSSSGAVCSTASIAGLTTHGSSLAYSTCKAGLIQMTRNLARALAPDIRVNAVAPGFVETEWTREFPPEHRRVAIDQTPLKRACQPNDIAETILFLCTGTTMITGQTLVVDGGLSL